MYQVVRSTLSLFNRKEKATLGLIFLAVVLMATLEVIGIASVAPFMSLVADPDAALETPLLGAIYAGLGFTDVTAFLVFAGLVVFTLILLSNSFTAYTTWKMLQFVWNKHDMLARRLLEEYIDQPYEFFLNQNTSRLSKNILAEVYAVTSGILVPGIQAGSRLIVVIFITALLVLVNPALAFVALAILGGAYAGLYAFIRGRQGRLGDRRLAANAERYKIAGEAFGGIKEVKAMGRETEFLHRFASPSATYSHTLAANSIIAQLPRYALEVVAFGGVLLIIVFLLQTGQDIQAFIPILGLYAFAGYRLMPALQKVFEGLTKVRFNLAALTDLKEDLARAATRSAMRRDVRVSDAPPLGLRERVELDRISYRYPRAEEAALLDVTAAIEKNTTVGFVGPTGSGKTTLADLVLGLYAPTEGEIRVDGTPLWPDNIAAWRRTVGYVPQQIFLTDDTVVHNVAFGIAPEKVDREQVLRACEIAHVTEFIERLPNGYDTVVGERGIRLSGGQRQRLGIARALYHDPSLLIMDEATSALDGITEDAVMDAIHDLSGKKTIILIAHRLRTVQEADTIFFLRNGRIEDVGGYYALLERNPTFRAMAAEGASA